MFDAEKTVPESDRLMASVPVVKALLAIVTGVAVGPFREWPARSPSAPGEGLGRRRV
jgi:hypothetical protein